MKVKCVVWYFGTSKKLLQIKYHWVFKYNNSLVELLFSWVQREEIDGALSGEIFVKN